MNRDYLPPSLLPPVCSQASSAMAKHHGPLDAMGGPHGPQSHPPPMVCRYSPVRRASEGSRITSQFQGPFQECQQLQKGLHAAAIAASQQQRSNNLLITPSPPLADNSVSLPGSPMHCKAFVDERSSATTGTLPDITVPHDVLLSLVPGLEKLVQENRLQIDTANSILHTRTMPYEVGHQLGLVRGGGSPAGAGGGGTLLLDAGMNLLQLQHSQSVSPLNATLRHHGGGGGGVGAGYGGAGGRPTGFPMLGGGMQPSYIAGGGGGGAFGNPYAFQNLMAAPGGAMSTVNASSTGMCHLSGLEYPGSNSNSGCPSPVYYASGCSSPILPGPPASIVSGCSGNMSGSGSGGGTGSASAGGGGAASPMRSNYAWHQHVEYGWRCWQCLRQHHHGGRFDYARHLVRGDGRLPALGGLQRAARSQHGHREQRGDRFFRPHSGGLLIGRHHAGQTTSIRRTTGCCRHRRRKRCASVRRRPPRPTTCASSRRST
uniref:DUF7084 domain-containing protein n=1 Tax=Anopheles coluzzii TaxID=1518534 RepID=A0A8W7PZZ7_ANOCL